MDDKKKDLVAINFSAKQMGDITEHNTAKQKDGTPLMMCKVFLPSKDFRPDDIDFGKDTNGIDRNERRAYINLPRNAVFDDRNREGRMFTYLDNAREYLVHFNGKPDGEPALDGKVTFDQPEPFKLAAKDLAHAYDGKTRTVEKDVRQAKTKEVEKAVSKSKAKTTKTKAKRQTKKKTDIER